MAFGIGTITLDSPQYKIFNITVLENDAAHLDTAYLYANIAMVNLAGAPALYWSQEVTASGAGPTVMCGIGLTGMTNTGFTVTKISAGGGGANTHTFRVYVMLKPAYAV